MRTRWADHPPDRQARLIKLGEEDWWPRMGPPRHQLPIRVQSSIRTHPHFRLSSSAPPYTRNALAEYRALQAWRVQVPANAHSMGCPFRIRGTGFLISSTVKPACWAKRSTSSPTRSIRVTRGHWAQRLHRLCHIARPHIAPRHDEIHNDNANRLGKQGFDIRSPFAGQPGAQGDEYQPDGLPRNLVQHQWQ